MRFRLHVLTAAMLCALAAQAQIKPPALKLKVGDAAPDFKLKATDGRDVSLAEFKGKKNVVLAFFFAAFTGG